MFSVSLTSADPAAILNPASADITIEDDDSEKPLNILWESIACKCHFSHLQWSQLDSMEHIQCERMMESLVLLYLF